MQYRLLMGSSASSGNTADGQQYRDPAEEEEDKSLAELRWRFFLSFSVFCLIWE